MRVHHITKTRSKTLTYMDGYERGYESQKNLKVAPTPRRLLAPHLRTAFQRGFIAGQNQAWADNQKIQHKQK